MSKAIENLMEAQKYAMSIRPKVGGFPVMAEVLRAAGVKRNFWSLPSCQSVYLTQFGTVVQVGEPLISKMTEAPPFNKEALIQALKVDQAGEGTFSQFLRASWEAGVMSYDVNFDRRTCTYIGSNGDAYIETYPAVEIKKSI